MPNKCLGHNRSGGPCSAIPEANGWCRWHDPAREAERIEWRRKGGRNRSNKARAAKQLPADPLSAAEVHSYLGVVFRGVIVGKLEPNIGTAAANIARAMIEVSKAAEFEDVLSTMRQELAELRGTA